MATCPCRMHLCSVWGHGCPRHCSSCACTQSAGAAGASPAAPSGWARGRLGHTVQWQRAGLCHPCNAVPCCAKPCRAVPCHALLCHTSHPGSEESSPQGCAILCRAGCPSSTASSLLAVPCRAIQAAQAQRCHPCRAGPYSAMPRCPMPRHAVLCHAEL